MGGKLLSTMHLTDKTLYVHISDSSNPLLPLLVWIGKHFNIYLKRFQTKHNILVQKSTFAKNTTILMTSKNYFTMEMSC